MRWDGGRSRRASEDRGHLDLDVRRPSGKRGTLEATAREQSTSGRSPVPLSMQLPERKRVRSLPCPCPQALCSALPLGGGMILALDHLLVRLLINQPWIGTQALGLGLFGHPPLGPAAACQGSDLSLSESGSSRVKSTSKVYYCYLAGPSSTVSQADAGADVVAVAVLNIDYKMQKCQRPSSLPV